MEWVTPRAPTCMSPLQVVKTNATAVMHGALAPAPRHQCVDAASAASFASTATSAARNLASTGAALSVNSSSSSDSEDSKMNGGGEVPLLGASPPD